MAAFEYTALDKRGKQKKGVQEGDNARQVRQHLRDQGMVPLTVEAVVEKESRTSQKGSRQRIKTADLALITRQLATLVDSGLPLEESLKAVSQQCDRPRLKSMVLAVRARVVEGHTLADSLKDFPHVFNQLYRSMVAAGEKSGNLGEVLERLADYTESSQAMRQKIQVAMIYPSLLILIAIGVVVGLLNFVVPKVVSQFDNMNAELPTVTKVLISISDAVRDYWLMTAIVTICAVVLFSTMMKKDNFKYQVHTLMLKFPLLGKVSLGLNTARFARTLSIMVASGVPLLEGLKIAGQVLLNVRLQDVVSDASIKVQEGSSLRAALQDCGYFPPMMIHMIASGENSGELEQMLSRAASNQEREFDTLISVLLGLMEPLIIVIMGAVVLFIVMAILMPIFSLNNLVG